MQADFLFELGTEELPTDSVKQLAKAMCNDLCNNFNKLNVQYKNASSFSTPRRLAVKIEGLDCFTPKTSTLHWGPTKSIAFDSSNLPTKAGEAFAKKFNIDTKSLYDFLKTDGDKEKLFYEGISEQIDITTLFQKLIQSTLSELPMPKKMRWGANKDYFVRPVKWAVLIFNNKVYKTNIFGLKTADITKGHRFHSDKELIIKSPESYESQLLSNKVIASFDKRKDKILRQITEIETETGLKAEIDENLLIEVTALCEWPVAIIGNFKEEYLTVPSEALISSMQEHQKFFHLIDANGNLTSSFITISNIKSKDANVVKTGNERVVNSRLADAAFFYSKDISQSLASRRNKLKEVVFQEKLGSLFDKTERLKTLARYLCEYTGADVDSAVKASELCKVDLITDMVNEFPSLQGVMGGYYAKYDGESDLVSNAIEEHYLPSFSGDRLPKSNIAITISLADKLDTVFGIFSTGAKPSGSKDPFGLRRSSLAILRLLIERNIDVDLKEIIDFYQIHVADKKLEAKETPSTIIAYILDRIEGWFKDQGIRTEIFLSVKNMSLSNPLDIDARVKAVNAFAQNKNAIQLAQLFKRVSNILDKNSSLPLRNSVDTKILRDKHEIQLSESITALEIENKKLLNDREYKKVLNNLLVLKEQIDNFFDNVLVDSKDIDLKINRLTLLKNLKALFSSTADLTFLAGEQG